MSTQERDKKTKTPMKGGMVYPEGNLPYGQCSTNV